LSIPFKIPEKTLKKKLSGAARRWLKKRKKCKS